MTEHEKWMARAIEISKRGEGKVEPNPMVGCVLVKNGQIIGEGWHQEFGGPHAEVNAFRNAGPEAKNSTAYVTLEPCCHYGKTPPCSNLLVEQGVKEVFIACTDPNPSVDGGGIHQLREAGISVTPGVLEEEARKVLAPFLKSMESGLPWIIAKWAMTLDGKIACHNGHSRWVTGTESRQRVHELRSRCDGIMIGSGTAIEDDPQLNYRPTNPDSLPLRTAARIVLDRRLRISLESNLVQTARQIPVIIATLTSADPVKKEKLSAAGCEIWEDESGDRQMPERFLRHLHQLGMTNILLEGGSDLLGTFFDNQWIDEVFAFIAPKIIGSSSAPSPVGGSGKTNMNLAEELIDPQLEKLGHDVLIRGQLKKTKS